MCAKNHYKTDGAKIKLLGSKPESYGSMAGEKESSLDVRLDGNKKTSKEYVKSEKPDGGWGWLIVLGVAVSNMTTQSLVSVFGLLFGQKLAELGIETSGAALIASVQTATLNLSGLIIGPVIRRFSYRKAATAGACFVMSGLLLTTYANSLWTFIFTYSVFTGVGLGLLYPSTFVAINSYFSKRRARAVGLSLAGTGTGQMLLPLLVRYLLDEYGFRGTIFILAAISSHSLLGATMYHPVEWHMKRSKTKMEKPVKELSESRTRSSDSLNSVELGGDAKASSPTVEAEHTVGPCEEKEPKTAEKAKDRGFFSWISQTMDLDLLKNPSFLNLVIGLGVVYSANMSFQMLFPFFLESVGHTRPDIAFCMSVLSGADIVGRLVVPAIADYFELRSKTVFFSGVALSALARSALVTQTQLLNILIVASCCGIVRAAIVCNFNMSISDQTRPEKLPAALGLHMVFKGMGIMSFGPVIGYIRDYTQSYTLCMHILSVFFLGLPFLTWLMETIITKYVLR